MAMQKFPKSSANTKKKYYFKITGYQNPIKRPSAVSAKQDDEWLKKFYLN